MFHVTMRRNSSCQLIRIVVDFFIFMRFVLIDLCQDTDDTEGEYVLGGIDEYELDYTSSSEDMFSNDSSSGEVMKNRKIDI